MFGWGVWETIHSVLGVSMLGSHPLTWTFWLLSGIADLLVGFLLGLGLITHHALSSSPAAMVRGQQLRARLIGIQAPLNALAMGVLYISFIYMV